jgi:hypothetical protein
LLGGTEENHKKSEDSWSPDNDLNTGPPEYEADIVLILFWCSVNDDVILLGKVDLPVKF